jgi:hypothetical protein
MNESFVNELARELDGRLGEALACHPANHYILIYRNGDMIGELTLFTGVLRLIVIEQDGRRVRVPTAQWEIADPGFSVEAVELVMRVVFMVPR